MLHNPNFEIDFTFGDQQFIEHVNLHLNVDFTFTATMISSTETSSTGLEIAAGTKVKK